MMLTNLQYAVNWLLPHLYCRELIPFFNFISPHSGAKPDSAYNLHPHFLGQIFFDHSPFSFMLIIIKEILAKIKLTVSNIFWFQYLFHTPHSCDLL